MWTRRNDARIGVMVPSRADRLCPPLVRRERPVDCCFDPSSELRLPDPAIYSQRQILEGSLPTPLTWNSPDINTNAVKPMRLTPEAQIIVRNLSTVASAANVRVDVSVFRFGIGFPREPIGGALLSIASAAQVMFSAPFPQRIMNGEQRIGIEVRITHPTDVDTGNNIGLQAFEFFYTSDAGRAFNVTFPVRNPSTSQQTIRIQAGPVDSGLSVIAPTQGPPFGPLEERMLSASISVMPGVAASDTTREATFMAFDAAGELVDGLTFSVNVDQ